MKELEIVQRKQLKLTEKVKELKRLSKLNEGMVIAGPRVNSGAGLNNSANNLLKDIETGMGDIVHEESLRNVIKIVVIIIVIIVIIIIIIYNVILIHYAFKYSHSGQKEEETKEKEKNRSS